MQTDVDPDAPVWFLHSHPRVAATGTAALPGHLHEDRRQRALAILVLVVIIMIDNVRVWLSLVRTTQPVGMNDDREAIYCPLVAERDKIDVQP